MFSGSPAASENTQREAAASCSMMSVGDVGGEDGAPRHGAQYLHRSRVEVDHADALRLGARCDDASRLAATVTLHRHAGAAQRDRGRVKVNVASLQAEDLAAPHAGVGGDVPQAAELRLALPSEEREQVLFTPGRQLTRHCVDDLMGLAFPALAGTFIRAFTGLDASALIRASLWVVWAEDPYSASAAKRALRALASGGSSSCCETLWEQPSER